MDQDFISRLYLCLVYQCLVGGQCRKGSGSRFAMGNGIRLKCQLAPRCCNVLGLGSAVSREVYHTEYLIAFFEAGISSRLHYSTADIPA